ncbi:hypothetical protein QN277_016049 [Acacia crassicarpa]|uniref:Uncharacterized protein n=1 Tax=Acacia crassicarpa TaxID=499986 RepID=A0AAE1TBP5_9FABA|nr:hypothetical protein QN277_016049 [Acacia crassicarpa]
MPTLNQLIRNGRKEKRRTDCTRASDQCPQKQGACPRVSSRTPKKPNSAPRKIAKVRLSNIKETRGGVTTAYLGLGRRWSETEQPEALQKRRRRAGEYERQRSRRRSVAKTEERRRRKGISNLGKAAGVKCCAISREGENENEEK